MIKIGRLQKRLKHMAKLCMLVVFMWMNNSVASPVRKINFWDTQQKGANIFNRDVTSDDIKAAKKYGIKFIRLAPDKFASLHRDFLIGNADDYRGLVKEDLAQLKKILDMCYQEKMPVVITMLSLPGSRWKQNNQDRDDLKIWKDEKYQAQAALFWQDLAVAFKDHPAVVGYNLLNEPHPERIFAPKEARMNTVHQEEVQKILYDLYGRVIRHIRLMDKETPIIVDSSAYADAGTFRLLIPQEEQNIFYSFHMYEPYQYTNHKMNKGKLLYPGRINGKQWDQEALAEYMADVVRFQKTHNIASNKILVGEFGGHRMSAGLARYFEDLIAIFNKEGWHFAFYAFREDTWDGMDYELGDSKLPWSYWQAVERGEKPVSDRKSTYTAFSIIKGDLDENRT
jgi:endoglucanase